MNLNLDSPVVTIGCVNIQALDSCFNSKVAKNPKWKHVDLLSGIEGLLRLKRVTIIPKHVYGHQDQHTAYEDLDRDAQMNVRMDGLAKMARALVED